MPRVGAHAPRTHSRTDERLLRETLEVPPPPDAERWLPSTEPGPRTDATVDGRVTEPGAGAVRLSRVASAPTDDPLQRSCPTTCTKPREPREHTTTHDLQTSKNKDGSNQGRTIAAARKPFGGSITPHTRRRWAHSHTPCGCTQPDEARNTPATARQRAGAAARPPPRHGRVGRQPRRGHNRPRGGACWGPTSAAGQRVGTARQHATE